jgi:hypothetical protein
LDNLVPTFSFIFEISKTALSISLLEDMVKGHNGFDFEFKTHDQEEIKTIFNCSAGEGLSESNPRIVPVVLETRGDDIYLVFKCEVGLGEDRKYQELRDVSLLISKPIEDGLQIDEYGHEGIIELTNSQGDKAWLYF